VRRQSLVEFFSEYAGYGSEIALRCRRGYRMESWTYEQIAAGANRAARELEAQGLGKGDAVLIWGENSPEWIVAFFGCLLRGAVAVPIDHGSTAEFVSRVARESKAKLIFRSQGLQESGTPIPTIVLNSLFEKTAQRDSSPYPSPPLTRDDALQIIFTSGTTADPRGVVITHGNVLANIAPLEQEIGKYLRYERLFHPLRFLNLLPLSHIFGQMLALFIPPLLKATVVIADSFRPSELMDTIRRERVSVLVAVPRLIDSLQREVERQAERDGRIEGFRRDFDGAEGRHFLRRWWQFRRVHARLGWKFWAIVTGGAALPDETETFWKRLGYAVIQGYGMTETTSLISLNHPFRLGKGSLGKVFPGMEVRVDEHGEILVRGENVAGTYRLGGKAQPIAAEDGWFRTGDLAEVGEEGRLYFKGRRKNVIVTSAGMNIFPEDLEKALRSQPGVRDCVVISLERNGNAEPCAVLLLDGETASGAAAVRKANDSLAEYQQVRDWFQWSEPDFPRTPTLKPLIARIREVASARIGAPVESRTGTSLINLIAQITGREISSDTADASLEADLHMTSLDRVELMSALEQRYQVDLSEVQFSESATVRQIERLLRKPPGTGREHIYPSWPQHWAIEAVRLTVYYLLAWPATYLLAAPRIRGRENLRHHRGPFLIISNHVTYLDIAWILPALPWRIRNRLATAMSGERLAEMRRPSRNLNAFKRALERLDYFLALALFNVFPMPQESGFLKAFSFTGDLADRGWSILIFPEGKTTEDGQMARFQSGVCLLAQRLNLPVVPIRLEGLFELKRSKRILARPGQVTVTVGKPVRFSADQDPSEIARDLERLVAGL
jgi:long-chain acyl-CoA synthetase